jgi:hypothetical protein
VRIFALAVALLVALIASFSSEASTSAKPALRVLDKAPLVLVGTGFKRAEWVRVKVTLAAEPAELSQSRRASRLGTFVMRFNTVVDVCYGASSANAVGMRGSRASIVLERPGERYCLVPGGAP